MGHRPAPSRRLLLLLGLLTLLPALVTALLTAAPATASTAVTQAPVAQAPVAQAPLAQAPVSGERVQGTLRNAGRPLEGVVIVVERNGTEVARRASDATGRFVVPVPGPGSYTARIDEATLPEGVDVRVGERAVTVTEGNPAPAAFQFGAERAAPPSRFERAPQLLVGGLQFGLVLAMASIGLSLIFGTTGLTNFAHGELITGGALLAYAFNVGVGLNLVLATLLAVVVGGLGGGLLDRGLWRPLRSRGTGLTAMLVVSIGLSLVLRYVYLYVFGGSQETYLQYATQDPEAFGPITILQRDMVIIAVSLLVLVGVAAVLTRTRLGKATRAVADNPSLAASSGIDVERVVNVVWVGGTALAVLGGVFLALSQQVGFQLGQNVLLLLFAGVTLGGLGTAYGALLGSLVVGVLTQLSTLFIAAELQTVGALIILILILIVRPQGLLGRRERVG